MPQDTTRSTRNSPTAEDSTKAEPKHESAESTESAESAGETDGEGDDEPAKESKRNKKFVTRLTAEDLSARKKASCDAVSRRLLVRE